jgi:transposase
MAHRNAKLTIHGRLLVIERLEAGWTQSQAADAGGVSRATVAKWAKRFREEGLAGLADRSSRPHRSPRMTPAALVDEVCRLRRELAAGPHRIAWELQLAASTVYGILRRFGLNLLAALDRTTREVVRYERERPGELVHLDVKKLGRIPEGGGKRFSAGFSENGAGYSPPGKRGVECIHVAVDDHSRFAYVEILPDERGETTVGFLRRMTKAFARQGLDVQRLLTDNGSNYRSKRPYSSNLERIESLQPFVHRYNHHRPHTGIGNNPPAARLAVNNLCGNNT